jgi:RNA polymerase sigma factor (sigma-70 family)
MLKEQERTILGVVRSARSGTPDPRLGRVLEDFRQNWLVVGRRRYRQLRDGLLEEAVQTALMKLVCSDKLDTLRDAARFEAWAWSLFVHTLFDLARHERRHSNGRTYVGGAPEGDPEHSLRDALPDGRPSPEDLASHRERLAIVARTASRLEVARLKFVEDLPENEIATRLRLTRYGVAGQLKRIRKVLRQALADSEYREGASDGKRVPSVAFLRPRSPR